MGKIFFITASTARFSEILSYLFEQNIEIRRRFIVAASNDWRFFFIGLALLLDWICSSVTSWVSVRGEIVVKLLIGAVDVVVVVVASKAGALMTDGDGVINIVEL